MQEQVAKKVALTAEALLDAVDSIRGAVMTAYPRGLPAWDRVRQALEGTEQLAGTSVRTHFHITPLLSLNLPSRVTFAINPQKALHMPQPMARDSRRLYHGQFCQRPQVQSRLGQVWQLF